MSSPFIVRAIEYAGYVHRNQKRKFSVNPYIVHPLHVALILSAYTKDEEILAAAILHDTIEDSEKEEKITVEILNERFGEKVARIVNDVTIQASEDTLEAKRASRQHILMCDWDSQMLKVADIISNTSYNVIRLETHSREEIEHEIGDDLGKTIEMNIIFLDSITNEQVIETGLIEAGREVLKELQSKI